MNNKEIYLVLDNIRSVHNVGAIFRTADAIGVSKFICVGIRLGHWIDLVGRELISKNPRLGQKKQFFMSIFRK